MSKPVRIPTKPRLVSGRFSNLKRLAEAEIAKTNQVIEPQIEAKPEPEPVQPDPNPAQPTLKDRLTAASTAFVSVPGKLRSFELMAAIQRKLPHLQLAVFKPEDQEAWRADLSAYLVSYDAIIVVSDGDGQVTGAQVWETITANKLNKVVITFNAATGWYSPYVGFMRYDAEGNLLPRWTKTKVASYKLRTWRPQPKPFTPPTEPEAA